MDDSALATPGGDTDPGSIPDLVWRAQLSASEQYVTLEGDAMTGTSAGDRAFKASVAIRNDSAGHKRPWRVWYGTCSTPGPMLGEAAAYPQLSTDSAGTASRTAWIPMALDTTASYHVTVHYSTSAFQRVIACGDLALQ